MAKQQNQERGRLFSKTPVSTLEKAPRIWQELAPLDPEIRKEFLRDYWINTLTYSPEVYALVDHFFKSLSGVDLLIESGRLYLVYSKENGREKFFGAPPLSQREALEMMDSLDLALPDLFVRFLSIHHGFSKNQEDSIFSLERMGEKKRKLSFLQKPFRMGDKRISGSQLLPFFEAQDGSLLGCFYDQNRESLPATLMLLLETQEVLAQWNRKEGRTDPTFFDFLTLLLEGQNLETLLK